MKYRLHVSALGLAIALACAAMAPTIADDETHIPISIKGHRFVPAEPTAPADKPVVFEVSNRDGTPAEFESKTLRVEKVVAGGGTISVQDPRVGARPLSLLRRLSRRDDGRLPRRPIRTRRVEPCSAR